MNLDSTDGNLEALSLPFQATAILLAGGRSTRMGRDKRHMDIDGTSLATSAYNRLAELFDQIIVSVRTSEILIPGARHVRDAHDDSGPLGGVVSAMGEAGHPIVFVMACDIPSPPEALIKDMLIRAQDYDVVVPVDGEGRYETLFAVYRREILPKLQELLDSGEKRIRTVYPAVATLELPLPPELVLKNLNTPEDVRDYLTGPARG